MTEYLLPDYFFPLAGTILGLIIGSFLATLIVRWPQDKTAIGGRSRCDHCDRQLRASELLPVVSYAVQGGKCRTCQAKIAIDHPTIELMAALIGGLALYISPDIQGLAGAIFGWLLLALAALDSKHHWLPDRLTFSLAGLGLLASLVTPYPDIFQRLIGFAAGFGSLFLIALAYRKLRGREGLGGGDPKLLGAIGCWLGWSTLPFVLMFAALIALMAVGMAYIRGQYISAETELPLGAFMAISAFPLWLYQTALDGSILLP